MTLTEVQPEPRTPPPSSAPSAPPPAAADVPVSLGLAVTAAGAVAQLLGLAAIGLAQEGSALRDAGGALQVLGLVVVVVGVGWQLASWFARLATRSRSAVAALAALAMVVVLAAGIGIGVRLAGDGAAEGGVVPTVPTTASPDTTASPTAASPNNTAATSTGSAPGSSTTAAAATEVTNVGAIIASQGRGSNSPPPSIDGVTFPSGDRRGSATGSPWSSTPLLPAAPPAGSEASTTSAAEPSATEPAPTSEDTTP